MAFISIAPALLGESTRGTGAASSGTVKQLENTWRSTGNAPYRVLSHSTRSSWPPGHSLAMGHGMGLLRACGASLSSGKGWSRLLGTKLRDFPSSHHPLSLPILQLWHAVPGWQMVAPCRGVGHTCPTAQGTHQGSYPRMHRRCPSLRPGPRADLGLQPQSNSLPSLCPGTAAAPPTLPSPSPRPRPWPAPRWHGAAGAVVLQTFCLHGDFPSPHGAAGVKPKTGLFGCLSRLRADCPSLFPLGIIYPEL